MEWLEPRLSIFRDFCLPSVAAQSRLPDGWLVFFDSETPPEALESFRQITGSHPFIEPILCGDFEARIAADAVRARLSDDCRWVITSRLDNDDALHRRHIEELGGAAIEGNREFLNFKSGLISAGHRLYASEDPSNPFIAASEPVTDIKTVLIDQHTMLAKYAPVRQLHLKYAWVQNIHDSNVVNSVRGTRISSASIDHAAYSNVIVPRGKTETTTEIAIDNTYGRCTRILNRARRKIASKLRKI
jgi:hypothetical protein